MRDLVVLKERIEYAERHLSASHSALERESQALMAMWRQIRDRFEVQEQEIWRYRAQIAAMEISWRQAKWAKPGPLRRRSRKPSNSLPRASTPRKSFSSSAMSPDSLRSSGWFSKSSPEFGFASVCHASFEAISGPEGLTTTKL